MTTLAAAALRALVNQGKTEIGLARSGAEVVADGYSRQPVDSWRVEDKRAEAKPVRFGPFAERVVYDSLLLVIDGAVVDTLPTADRQANSVAPGTEIVARAVLRSEDV